MLLRKEKYYVYFFKAEDGIRDIGVTGVQTCALPISEIAELEATEPEMEPSTAEEPPVQAATQDLGGPAPEVQEERAQVEESAQTGEPAPTAEPAPSSESAAEEVDREEPTLAEERSSESFFDRERGGTSSQEGEQDSRIFRASRFLRRRE